MRRFGLMGGTFHPIHQGHIELALRGYSELALSRVLFLPTGDPPHKILDVDKWHRLSMVQVAVAPYAQFSVLENEVRRPGKSYTADTLKELHAHYPGTEFFFLVGGDTLLDIPHWRSPQDVLALCHIAAFPRVGIDIGILEQAAQYLRDTYHGQITLMHSIISSLSSTQIRTLLKQGKILGPDMIPSAVMQYIASNHLYKGEHE